MANKFFFRADANSKIGLGHLMRLMALADMLKKGFECVFIIQEPSESIRKIIIDKSFEVISLKSKEDFLDEAKEIADLIGEPSIIVIDGYNFDETYVQELKFKGHKVVLIDDFVKSFYNVDAIINHAVGLKKGDYDHQNITYCLGADHVLLRPSFLRLAKEKRRLCDISKAFVCFGGADHHNLTLKVLQALEGESSFEETNVVLAASFPYKESIEEYVKKSSQNIILHYNLNEEAMAILMSQCHFAFGPTSGLSFEICAAKMVFVGGYYVDNQKAIHDGFNAKGCLSSLGDLSYVEEETIKGEIKSLLSDRPRMKQMIANQQSVIDGKSDQRLYKALSNLLI